MRKGRQIFVEGRLKLDTWERDGQRRSKLSVVCETFQFIDSQGGGGSGSGSGSYDRAPANVGSSSSSNGGGGGGNSSSGDSGPVDDFPADDDIPF